MKKTALKITEAHIEQTCTQMLELDGWRSLKTNPVSNRARGAGFGEKGMADFLYIRYRPQIVQWNAAEPGHNIEWKDYPRCQSEVLWIEWKRLGNKAKQHQEDWHVLERKCGALTLIAGEDFPASIEGFKDWYLASGLNRNMLR